MQRLTIGHYEIQEELGRGLFGVTCRGAHLRVPGQQVALKIARSALVVDPSFRAGLERASFALRSLIHPGIASFLTLRVEGERLGVVRELVDGEPATALLASGPQPVGAVTRLLEEALAALAAVHAFGLAHGDLKPSDIFLGRDGRVRLTDPGLGVLARAAFTPDNGLPPAPLGHLAPEGSAAAGPRADLYALGLVAWELLVGHAACPPDEPVAMLGWHRYQGLTDPRHARGDCPPWLATVLLRLSAIDPQRRPADAARASELLQQTRAAAPSSVLVTPPAPRRVPPGPPPVAAAVRDDLTLPHRLGPPPAGREDPTLPHTPELAPLSGPGFGGQQAPAPLGAPPEVFGALPAPASAPFGATAAPAPAPEPAPVPVPTPRRGLGPAPAPVLAVDPGAKRREAIKVAVFWSITIGFLVVSVVSYGGYRAMEARRLTAARDLGTDISPDLLLGGYAERSARDEDLSTEEPAAVHAVPAQAREVSGAAPTPAKEPRPSVAAAFPPEERGVLSLSSNPIGAKVWLDNAEIGHTPLEGFSLAPGHHIVRVELDGYQWASRSVDAAPGAAVDLGRVPLERVVAEAGPVQLWSPGLEGASVFVDGRHVGRLPVETVLTPGTHTFFVQPAEGEPVERSLEVRPGREGAPARVLIEAP